MMSTVRSPNYPQIDLGSALEAVRAAYAEEHRNKMSRNVLAKHLGYGSLNGRALAKMGALRAYGLIEGLQDDIRVTDDAVICLEAPSDASERGEALSRCGLNPPIFREIRASFETLPSEHNLRFFLVKRGYTPEAAGKAAQNYLATMRLVGDQTRSNEVRRDEAPVQPDTAADTGGYLKQPALAQAPPAGGPAASLTPPGTRRTVFDLTEGEVVITFPDALSAESVSDLQDYISVFMKKAKRDAGIG
jgi:hypothetical protein